MVGPEEHFYIYKHHIPALAPSKGSPMDTSTSTFKGVTNGMEAPTLLRDLHWTPIEGPGVRYIFNF